MCTCDRRCARAQQSSACAQPDAARVQRRGGPEAEGARGEESSRTTPRRAGTPAIAPAEQCCHAVLVGRSHADELRPEGKGQSIE